MGVSSGTEREDRFRRLYASTAFTGGIPSYCAQTVWT
jgi:hypothetical protein